MTSCTIIISHYENEEFLKCCLRQIEKHSNPAIEVDVIVCDQSKDQTNILKIDWDNYLENTNVNVVYTQPLYSGYGLDWVMRNVDIKGEYICQLHADCVPINDKYLLTPINLIKEYGFSFVGQLQFVNDGSAKIYPPDPFCAMAQCFNVATSSTYLLLSFNAGFTRFHNRVQSELKFICNDWAEWAKEDYESRGSDDDVVAFHLEDKYWKHNKLGLAITGMIGLPEDGPSWGRVIDDLVFHFGSANESRGVIDKMTPLYQKFTQMIKKHGLTDEIFKELIRQVNPHKSDRTFWDGTSKVASKANEDLSNRIEKLKHGLD